MSTINQHTTEAKLWTSVLSPDAKYLALILPNDEISLRNPVTGAQYGSVKRGLVHMLAFSPNGKILVTASRFGSISLLDTKTSAVRYQVELDRFDAHWDRPTSQIAISSNERHSHQP